MSHSIQPLQQAITNPVTSPVQKKDSDGDGDKSAASAKIGPAVILNLQNAKTNHVAQGDPDGDGH